jgi:putative Mg2+ transporter-C (MgtC) family protein
MTSLKENWFLDLSDRDHYVRVALRLGVAMLLGAALGYGRERMGKPTGLRTHMLVALGAALFVLAPIEAGVSIEQLMRVVQGLTAGIGFLGAGAILKMAEERKISGVTTAASIWITAAVGTAVGMGLLWPALCAVILGGITLYLLRYVEH